VLYWLLINSAVAGALAGRAATGAGGMRRRTNGLGCDLFGNGLLPGSISAAGKAGRPAAHRPILALSVSSALAMAVPAVAADYPLRLRTMAVKQQKCWHHPASSRHRHQVPCR